MQANYGNNYALPFTKQFAVVLNRSAKLLRRNKQFIFANRTPVKVGGFVWRV